jgi:hypothetical protein
LLEGGDPSSETAPADIQAMIVASTDGRPVTVDWQGVEHALQTQSGVPAPVSNPQEKRRGVTAASSVEIE